MDYTRIISGLRKHGEEVTPASVAAVLTVEFQIMLALLLAMLALLRMFSNIIAVVILIPMALFSLKVFYPDSTFQENDDRFNTLLFYFIATLVVIILLVGWQM